MTAVQPPARDLEPTAELAAALRRPPRKTPRFQLPPATGPKDQTREAGTRRKGSGAPAQADDQAEAGAPPTQALPTALPADLQKPPLVAAALAEAGQAVAPGPDDRAGASPAAPVTEAANGVSRQTARKADPGAEVAVARNSAAAAHASLEPEVDPADDAPGASPGPQQTPPASETGDRALVHAAARPAAAAQAPDPAPTDAPRPTGNPAQPAGIRRAGAAAAAGLQPSAGFRLEPGPAGGQPRLHGAPEQAAPAQAAARQVPEPSTPADVLVSRGGPGGLEVVIAAATPDLRDRFRAATDELHGDLQRIGTEVDAIRVELRGEMGAEGDPGGRGAGDDAPAAQGQPEGQPADWNWGPSNWGLANGGEPDAAARVAAFDDGTGSAAASGQEATRADGADADSPSGDTTPEGEASDRTDPGLGGSMDRRGGGGVASREGEWLRLRLSPGAAGSSAELSTPALSPAAAPGPGPRFDRYA
jgi:hypothetical protein